MTMLELFTKFPTVIYFVDCVFLFGYSLHFVEDLEVLFPRLNLIVMEVYFIELVRMK